MNSSMISIIYLQNDQCLRTQIIFKYIDFSHLQAFNELRTLIGSLQLTDL